MFSPAKNKGKIVYTVEMLLKRSPEVGYLFGIYNSMALAIQAAEAEEFYKEYRYESSIKQVHINYIDEETLNYWNNHHEPVLPR